MYKQILFTTTIVFLCWLNVSAQTQTKSPYSKLGIGLMEHPGNIINSGMGGVSVTLFKRNALNMANPAAISSLDTLSFVMEFGLKSDFSQMSIPGETKNSFSSNLNYFAFGFRAGKRWSSSIGLTPISSRGYKILDRDYNVNIGDVDKYYLGSGGINTVFITNSFDILENFSAGITANYMFGKLEETNTLMFSNLAGSYNTQEGIKQQISDFGFSIGAHYRLKQTETKGFEFGLSLTPNSKIKGEESFIKGTTRGQNLWSADDNTFIDTIAFHTDKPIEIEKPLSLTFGAGQSQLNKYNAAIEYTFSNWASTGFANTKNSHRIAVGYSFIPQWNSAVSYSKRSTYRFGAFFESTNMTVKGTDIANVGIATGVGLPVRRGIYNVDLDLQVGQMGTNKNDQIKDYYARLNLKIRFSEIWFYKPKYD
jgi:hypothetical protein